MSAARYALLKIQDLPPHVKNWRPQILLMVKCNVNGFEQTLTENENLDFNVQVEKANSFAIASQLKDSRGLFLSASVIQGDHLKFWNIAKKCKNVYIINKYLIF